MRSLRIPVPSGRGVCQLGASAEDVSIRDPQNMKPKDIKKAIELLEENWDDAAAKWEEYHG